MKIRVTIMTENEKHLPGIPNEKLEAIAQETWEMLLHILNDSKEDKATVEKIEIIEN